MKSKRTSPKKIISILKNTYTQKKYVLKVCFYQSENPEAPTPTWMIKKFIRKLNYNKKLDANLKIPKPKKMMKF